MSSCVIRKWIYRQLRSCRAALLHIVWEVIVLISYHQGGKRNSATAPKVTETMPYCFIDIFGGDGEEVQLLFLKIIKSLFLKTHR